MFSTPSKTPRRAPRSSGTTQGVTPRLGVSLAVQLPESQHLNSTSSRARITRAGAGSRLNAASPAPSARTPGRGLATASVMDEDENGAAEKRQALESSMDKVLVKDAAYVVLERKGLPSEVDEVLNAADPYMDPLRASLDSLTGFASLVSREYCIVWNWSRRFASSTTYVFPISASNSLPAVTSAFSPLSFATFVPAPSQPSQREPGLLIVSPTGDVRYWENVSMALSGVERWKGAAAKLEDGELVRGVTLHSPTSYLLSTTQSRILLVTLSSAGGRIEVSVRAFERALGWGGAVWSFFGGKGAADPRSGILALALSPPVATSQVCTAYAVADKSVQVWKLPGRDDEGGEKLLVEQDLFAGVLEALTGSQTSNETWALNEGRVEILDAQVSADGQLLVLVSHVSASTAANALSYALVTLAVGTTQNSVTAAGVRHLSYQARVDPRPLSSPKISSTTAGVTFVVFVDAVIMISTVQGTTFEETFPLRSSTNRFLGISTLSSANSSTPSLHLLTSASSILSVEITAGLVLDSRSSEETKTRKLKSKIEQAIFFGGDATENPLAFDLLPDFEGNLIIAAQAVSTEILASSSENLPSIIDLRAQLADRGLRTRALIHYIGANGLLGKLSQSCRRTLSADSERLAAAGALWQHQNARLSERQESSSLLAGAISAFMTGIGEAFSDDLVRAFFRTKVVALGTVIEEIARLTKTHLATCPDSSQRTSTLHEANALILLVYKATLRHRTESSTVYGIDSQLLPVELWSSRTVALDILQWSFESTAALLQERNRDFGNAAEQSQFGSRGGDDPSSDSVALLVSLRQQLSELAGFLFSMFEERLLFLATVGGDGAASVEYKSISERYLALRPRVISTLVSNDKVKPAYELAERHRDFRSLVELCNDAEHGSTSRMRFLMEKYGEEFAFALYHFFVERGQLQALMQQDDLYRPLLTKFLDSTDNPKIDWINDFAISRFDHATSSLVQVATSEVGLSEKRLMLSLAKLSQVAQATHASVQSETVQRKIELIDDGLDLVNSQQAIAMALAQNLSALEMRQPIATQAALITSRVALNLGDRPAFVSLYAEFTARLLRNEAISAEDTIDMLTLKENVGQHEGDYAVALDILVRAKDTPRVRHALALQNIWRRVYLRDDWGALRSTTGLTDDQVGDALRATALHTTLVAAEHANLPSALYLTPEQSCFTATSEEVAARFSELPLDSIHDLVRDFEHESAVVQDALQSHGLRDYYDEIKRLLRNQPMAAQGEDSMMQ